jgi:ABC-type phosphate/phosphonate transport system ATPase subunit
VELKDMVDGWRQLDDEEIERGISDKIVVAVMGRVSAGKSTLMKALLQIAPENTDVLQVYNGKWDASLCMSL